MWSLGNSYKINLEQFCLKKASSFITLHKNGTRRGTLFFLMSLQVTVWYFLVILIWSFIVIWNSFWYFSFFNQSLPHYGLSLHQGVLLYWYLQNYKNRARIFNCSFQVESLDDNPWTTKTLLVAPHNQVLEFCTGTFYLLHKVNPRKRSKFQRNQYIFPMNKLT